MDSDMCFFAIMMYFFAFADGGIQTRLVGFGTAILQTARLMGLKRHWFYGTMLQSVDAACWFLPSFLAKGH
jgi:hypothetical protein